MNVHIHRVEQQSTFMNLGSKLTISKQCHCPKIWKITIKCLFQIVTNRLDSKSTPCRTHTNQAVLLQTFKMMIIIHIGYLTREEVITKQMSIWARANPWSQTIRWSRTITTSLSKRKHSRSRRTQVLWWRIIWALTSWNRTTLTTKQARWWPRQVQSIWINSATKDRFSWYRKTLPIKTPLNHTWALSPRHLNRFVIRRSMVHQSR